MPTDQTKDQMPFLPRSYCSANRPAKRKGLLEGTGDPSEDAEGNHRVEEPVGEMEHQAGDAAAFEDSAEDGWSAEPEEIKPAAITCPGCSEPHARLPEEVQEAAGQATSLEDQEFPPESFKVRVNVAGVRFSYAGKIYHFDAEEMPLKAGDKVIVKTEKGTSMGKVALPPRTYELDPSDVGNLCKVIRVAGRLDMEQLERCREREAKARAYCLERIEALGLPMKLVDVECFFDGSKYVFYFTADGRVDFRELVKQLVARFPVRIEMRQIGVRHEAKMTGGIACCGQELCCARFLADFKPVSVKMAKTQNLSLNPTKISGVCGRLMCCLSYEHDIYERFRNCVPRVGKSVKTSKGEGVVLKHNPLNETILVALGEDSVVEVSKDEVISRVETKTGKKPAKGGGRGTEKSQGGSKKDEV